MFAFEGKMHGTRKQTIYLFYSQVLTFIDKFHYAASGEKTR